jgi:hypothetical protein
MSFSTNYKKLISGKYEFFSEGQQYAEESFEILTHAESKTIWYKTYLFTRSTTGELLKIFIDYELNENFFTKSAKIKKNAGKWTTEENFIFDPKENILHYSIKNPDGEHKEDRVILKRFYIQTPSVVCSALFASGKKTDNSARNPAVLIKSPNNLNYEGNLEEYTIFVSYDSRDSQTFNINQNHYQYIRCELYATDLGELESEFPIVLQISKKFCIPFLVQFDLQHQARLVQLETAGSIDTNAL